MRLYDTRSRSVREFRPLRPPRVSLYCCGPTVYDVTHIGHMRKYVMDDVLRRALEFSGYTVTHVMNITDVGHLSDDGDGGEDKLEKGARKHGKTVWDVAAEYTDFFHTTMRLLNVLPPHVEPKATDHIEEMIRLILQLKVNDHTYETDEAVYFDVSTFPRYGQLSKQKLGEKRQGVREDVYADPKKRNPQDFALWFKRVGRFANHSMYWDSPWGPGFPGWHIECSAMSMRYLGPSLDIHTGGIDHIPVHHENEIAQSECATGEPFVQFWVHHAFLLVDGVKMSKSVGNVYTYKDITAKGIHPLAIRLLFLQSHYRQEMNFTWESAGAAHTAFERLREAESRLRPLRPAESFSPRGEDKLKQFHAAIEDDLNTPKALAVLWETVSDTAIPAPERKALLRRFDLVLGFSLEKLERAERKPVTDLPPEIAELVSRRGAARAAKDWKTADALRDELASRGFSVEDIGENSVVYKN